MTRNCWFLGCGKKRAPSWTRRSKVLAILKYPPILSQKIHFSWKLALVNENQIAVFLLLSGVLHIFSGFFYSRSEWQLIVKAILTCFVKFRVIENASICKCLAILTKPVQVYITGLCFLKLSLISWKEFLLVPCLLDSERVIIFSHLSIWQNLHFIHSVLVLTSAVSVVLLWPLTF